MSSAQNGNNSIESPEDDSNAQAEGAKRPVEYYVHYLEQERPMDRWVKENMVKISDELVENLLEDFKRREEEKKR